jgi:hypothetical protein
MKLIFISGDGDVADAGQFDDSGSAIYRVQGGEHDGHKIVICTEKHNCGAYGESVSCSCGAYWQSAMYGCWQQGHQRQEEGDKSLQTMLVCERIGEPVDGAA